MSSSIQELVLSAARSISELSPFRFGMDRDAYKTSLCELQSSLDAINAQNGKNRPFDVRRLIYLNDQDFRHELRDLIEAIEKVAKDNKLSLPEFNTRKTSIVDDAKSNIEHRSLDLHQYLGRSEDQLREDLQVICVDGQLSDILAEICEEAAICFDAGAFRAASILAGSFAEGLLFGVLQGREAGSLKLSYQRSFPKRAPKALDSMGFDEMVAVASDQGLLVSGTRHFSKGVKELRNLVHPAIEIREGARCSAIAAEVALKSALLLLHDLRETNARSNLRKTSRG